jgi:hypothetical protein
MGLTGHGTIVDVVLIIAILIVIVVVIKWLIVPLLYGGGADLDMIASLKPMIQHTTHTHPLS